MAGMNTNHSVDTELSTSFLLEQFAERLKRRGVTNPNVEAVVLAAQAEAFALEIRSTVDRSGREVGDGPAV